MQVTDATANVRDSGASLTMADLRRLRRFAPYRWPLPWRDVLPRAVALWLVSRLFDAALTVLFTTGDALTRLNHWWFWDAGFYAGIAKYGYTSQRPAFAPFFPLYPLLLHPLQGPQETERLIADLAVGNLGTLLAFVFVGLLAAHEARNARAALAPLLLLAVSPLSVFLAGAYSDGLFIGLVAWTLLLARRRQWGWAALTLALVVVTRPFGVLLIPALLLELGAQRDWWWRLRASVATWNWQWFALTRRDMEPFALLIVLPSITLGSYLFILWRAYDDPLALFHVEDTVFGHALLWPWQTVALAVRQMAASPRWSYQQGHIALDLAPPLLCFVVALIMIRRWPHAFTLYTLLIVAVCLSSATVHVMTPDVVLSAGRYTFAAAPVLLQFGGWMQRWPRWLVISLLCLSLTLQGVLTVFVLRGGWLV